MNAAEKPIAEENYRSRNELVALIQQAGESIGLSHKVGGFISLPAGIERNRVYRLHKGYTLEGQFLIIENTINWRCGSARGITAGKHSQLITSEQEALWIAKAKELAAQSK